LNGGNDVSGPIVRRYGFPNFDEIFGKRELQHGVDEENTAAGAESPSGAPAPAEASAPKAKEKKKKKS
jgi:hypothetical protein